jgi:hypothetical protein
MTRRALYYPAYQNALKNVEAAKPSLQDEMIVALWDTVATLQKSLAEKTLKLSLTESHQVVEVNEASALLDRFRSGTLPLLAAIVAKPTTTQGEE